MQGMAWSRRTFSRHRHRRSLSRVPLWFHLRPPCRIGARRRGTETVSTRTMVTLTIVQAMVGVITVTGMRGAGLPIGRITAGGAEGSRAKAH